METAKDRSESTLAVRILLAASLLIVAASAAPAADPETEAGKLIGKNLASSFAAEYGTVNDPLLDQWVQRTAARLTPLSPRQNLHYHFTILDTAEVNAFTLPGGYIFVTRGLLDYARGRDEVAGVMGHEIGHVAKRHPVRTIEWELASALALRYAPLPHGTLPTVLEQGALFLTTLQFSRRNEEQADLFGIDLATRAGYDPAGLRDFIQDLGVKAHPGLIDRYLATHPPDIDRIRALDRTPFLQPGNWQLQQQVAERMLASCRPSVAAHYLREALAAHPGDPGIRQRLNEARKECGVEVAAPGPALARSGPAQPPSERRKPPPADTASTLPETQISEHAATGGGGARLSRQEAESNLDTARQETDARVKRVARSLAALRSLKALNVNLQDALLAATASRLGDVRWIVLAYQAFGDVNRVDDVFARIARVDYRLSAGISAMRMEVGAAPSTAGPAVWGAADRFSGETRAAAGMMADAAGHLDAASVLLSAALADLDTALLGITGQVTNVRFAALEAALLAANREIDLGRRLAVRSVDTLGTAEDRVLLLQIDRIGASADAEKLAIYDCGTADLLGVAPSAIQAARAEGTSYGDAVAALAISIEIGKPVAAVRDRYERLKAFELKEKPGAPGPSWVDAAADQGGSPALMEIMLRQVAQALREEEFCG